MHPFSFCIPKELVPLGNVPAIHFVLDEVVAAGIPEVAIVVRPGKRLLSDHLERAQSEGLFSNLRIEWVTQAEPLGLGDAIASAIRREQETAAEYGAFLTSVQALRIREAFLRLQHDDTISILERCLAGGGVSGVGSSGSSQEADR